MFWTKDFLKNEFQISILQKGVKTEKGAKELRATLSLPARYPNFRNMRKLPG